MTLDSTPRFWRSLLLQRREASWGNFSWLSAGVLLQSANDQVAKNIDSTIVNGKRMRLVADQRSQGINASVPLRLLGAKTIILLGDPGEMDASQYVLLRELYATEADTLILMSDIIYPAGNVNAWRDAVYLPYFGLPRCDWSKAIDEWREDVGGVSDDGIPEPPSWRVFATPGNHDWYDGLSGFMFNACRSEPLPEVLFSQEGVTGQQSISRALWQRAPRPDRSTLEALRVEVEKLRSAAERKHSGSAPDHDIGDVGAVGAMPRQPGPYFAIDVVAGRRRLRLVSVDTGIDGSIDVEQAIWAQDILAEKGVPKIVITGKPLAVNQKISRFPIDGGAWMSPGRVANPAIRDGKVTEDHVDLRDLLRDGDSVVATIAGDIHNFQRMVLRGERTTQDRAIASRQRVMYLGRERHPVAIPKTPGLPPLQLVAGGGGAYLTETHGVRLDADGGLTLRDEREQRDVTVPAGQHTRYPSREESVLLFGRNVRPGVCAAILALSGVGAALAAFLFGELVESAKPKAGFGELEITTWQAVVGSFGTLAVLAVAAFLVAVRGTMVRVLLKSPFFLVLALGSLALFVAGWSTKLSGIPLVLGGALIALAIPLLLIIVPLVRAYPSLRRLFPAKTALVGLGTYLAVFEDISALLIVGAVAGTAIAYIGLRWVFARLHAAAQDWAIAGTNEGLRIGLLVLSFWPIGLIVVAATLGLDELRVGEGTRDAIRIIAAVDLLIAMTAAAAFTCRALWSARRTIPTPFAALVWTAFAAGVAGWLFFLEFESTGLGKTTEGLLAPFCGVGAALLLASIGILLRGGGLPDELDVTEALRSRDLKDKSSAKSMKLFRVTAVSHLPGVGQLAEATHPPFYKSFVTMKVSEERALDGIRVDFVTFGVKDEREPETRGHPASNEPCPRGSYPVDTVSIVVPDVPEDRSRRSLVDYVGDIAEAVSGT